MWIRFWNPEFFTTLNGRRSSTINCRIAPEIAFALLELCGSLAANNCNFKRACWPEWVVCFVQAVASEHSEDVDWRYVLFFFARNQLGLLCFRYISISFGQGTTCMQLWSYPQACFPLQSQSVAICSPLLSCLALFSKDSFLSTMFVTQQLHIQ